MPVETPQQSERIEAIPESATVASQPIERFAGPQLVPQLREKGARAGLVWTPKPTRLAMINAMDGWTTQFHIDGQVVGGPLALDKDSLLMQQLAVIGGAAGKRILELGPMEGGHTRLLCEQGAEEVVAVEGFIDCWLRCLVVKEAFGLAQARFLYGDFCPYLAEYEGPPFDLALARGVLYHQINPAQVIHDLARVAPVVFVWAQVADTHSPDGAPITVRAAGQSYSGRLNNYQGARDSLKNYCGGVHPTSVWLFADELKRAFREAGFTELLLEQPGSTPSGASLAFVARRPMLAGEQLPKVQRQVRQPGVEYFLNSEANNPEVEVVTLGHARALRDLEAARETAQIAEAELQRKLAEVLSYRQQLETIRNFADGVSASWSWKLLGPIRAARTWVSPRRYGRSRLLPLQQLEFLDQDTGYLCQATSNDPQFLLPCTLRAGWIRIDYSLDCDVSTKLEIFADHGQGFLPQTRVYREQVEGSTERTRYIYLHKPTRALRLDPLDDPGRFHLERFELRTVPAWEALGRAVGAKLRLLFTSRCFGSAMLRGAGLLVRGQIGEFIRRLYKPMAGDSGENSIVCYQKAYAKWRELRVMTDSDRERLRRQADSWVNPPLISILLPVWNTPEKLLRLCIESVLRQTYPHWQLCAVDDGSTLPSVRQVLEEYAAKDSRITLRYRQESGGISEATNGALEVARGDFIALLDHDDELAEHALSKVADKLVDDPSLDMIYSDEDKLEPDGRHADPFFKPDWSPEYFLGCMYTCHLGVYRASLARQIGGFRKEFDTAQDYDFVLRLTARTQRIAHIPDILYHWRKTPTSTASGGSAKPRAHETAAQALRSWLKESGKEGTVEPTGLPGFHRVRFALRDKPTISIVIPSGCKKAAFHGKETWLVLRCIESIRELTTYPNVEIVVLYNDKIDAVLERRLNALGVRLIQYLPTQPFNLADKMNVGARHASGKQLLFLNDDIEVSSPDWLEAMLEYSQQEEIGAVGAKLLFPNGRLQHCGVLVPSGCPTHAFYTYPGTTNGYFNSHKVVRNWIAATGACLMTRAEVFRSVGGFDVIFPLNYNDVDYCLKLRERGLRTVCVPYAQLIHYESATKEGWFPVELATFQARWKSKLPMDPYHNPNFDQTNHEFQIDTRKPG